MLVSKYVHLPVPIEGCWDDQRGCPAAVFTKQKSKFEVSLSHLCVRTIIGFEVSVILIYVIYFSLLHGQQADR